MTSTLEAEASRRRGIARSVLLFRPIQLGLFLASILLTGIGLIALSAPAQAQGDAPDLLRVRFETSEGAFVIEAHRAWSPRGVDRFLQLVASGFFDDSRFFRVVPGFIAQFGLPGDPARAFTGGPIADDPAPEPPQSNLRGTLAFAMTGPDTRMTQIYVNLADNSRLDAQGFRPIGRVVEGMEVVDRLYSGYGEGAGGGVRGGKQGKILAAGNAHLDADFPRLSHLVRARLLEESQ